MKVAICDDEEYFILIEKSVIENYALEHDFSVDIECFYSGREFLDSDLKSYDIAFDIRLSINDLIYDMSGRGIEKIDNRGFDNKTIMLGKGDGRVKIYNKKLIK